MLRRALLACCLTLMPALVLAVADAPVPTAPATVDGALFDQVTVTKLSAAQLKAQGTQAYVLSFHNDQAQYNAPLCASASLVEVDGSAIDPTSFVMGDTLSATLTPNAAATAKYCISRVVRQQVSRGASAGECLQNYQVKHELEGAPGRLVTGQEYTYVLSIYNRPTLDCDGKAYGANPITTTVAAGQPFVITLDRANSGGRLQLMKWSLTTSAQGKARLSYTFAVPADTYQFHITPGGNVVAGDTIEWDAAVTGPASSDSPAAATTAGNPGLRLGLAPVITVLVLALLAAIGLEYWRWFQRRRENESPEQEYQRVEKL